MSDIAKTAPPTDSELDHLQELTDQLLAAHVAAGGTPQDLQLRLVHRKRKTDAAKAKSAQPRLEMHQRGMADCDCPQILKALTDEFRKPITDIERSQAAAGMDQLLISFQEFLDAGDLEDAIHAAFRVARKAYIGQFSHLGLPIDLKEWHADAKKAFGVT